MALSQSPILLLISLVFATITTSYGLTALLQPSSALTPFSFTFHPTSLSHDQHLIHGLLYLFGIRDIFMGFSIFVATYYGRKSREGRKVLGWLLMGVGGVAFGDGWVCWMIVGRGMWNHWIWVPVGIGLGVALVGLFHFGRT